MSIKSELKALQKIAREALSSGDGEWYDKGDLAGVETDADDKFISTFSPRTVLRVLAFAMATDAEIKNLSREKEETLSLFQKFFDLTAKSE